MLDYDQTYFGCGNKLPANNLRDLLEEVNYSFLLPDNNIVKIDNGYIHSTIDTVFPFVDDISTYVMATILHCANDIYASGIKPIQASVSVGISNSLDKNEIKLMFKCIQEGLDALGINSCNYHTFRADQTSITITMNGISRELKPEFEMNGCYDIFLTKPVGVWSTRNIRCQEEDFSVKAILSNNLEWLDFIRSDSVKYATDISGFGLIGHLASIIQNKNYLVSLSLDSVLGPLNFEAKSAPYFLGCSAKSNLESFGSLVENIQELDDIIIDVLFGGEINGPILAIVERDAELGEWFDKLIHIGTASPHMSTKNQIIKVRD